MGQISFFDFVVVLLEWCFDLSLDCVRFATYSRWPMFRSCLEGCCLARFLTVLELNINIVRGFSFSPWVEFQSIFDCQGKSDENGDKIGKIRPNMAMSP